MVQKARVSTVLLKGSEEGYRAYRKYLSINAHFKRDVPALKENGVRLSRCSKEKYVENKLQRVFERLGKSMNDKDIEKLFVYYELENQFSGNNKYVNEYTRNDLIKYDNVIMKYSHVIKGELRDLFHEASQRNIFTGSPSIVTRKVYTRQIRPETYIYLSLLVDIPVSDDMATSSVLSIIDRYRPWFYYFTGITEDEHQMKAKKMLKSIKG